MFSNNISATFQQTKKGESFTYDTPSLLYKEWSWRDSNPRPHKETIRFLHAYSSLRFSRHDRTWTTNHTLIL